MIYAISYGNEKYKNALHLNLKMALKYGKADKVRGFTDADLSEKFKLENAEVFNRPRGGGYWIWKPQIILKALDEIEDGDYVVYTDAGSAFINRIELLTNALEKSGQDIMCFSLKHIEAQWTKRDAFILMECDSEEYVNSEQLLATYIIVRKSSESIEIIRKYASYVLDRRIVTDEPNVMGKPNYPGFIENRHDQTVWSLLCKKKGIKPFCDPSQYGSDRENFPEDMRERSVYPQVIDSFRHHKFRYEWQLRFKPYRHLRLHYHPKRFIVNTLLKKRKSD